MRMYFPSRLPTWRLGERDCCYSNDVIFVREKHSSEDLALLCAVFQELEIIYWLRHVEMEFSFCQVRTCFRISADITQLFRKQPYIIVLTALSPLSSASSRKINPSFLGAISSHREFHTSG